MLKRLIDVPLTHRWVPIVATVVLIALGMRSLLSIPVDAFPDLTNNQVVINAVAPGMAPAEVERRVTYPIESAMMGLPSTLEVRSLTKLGLSMVTVVFEDDVETYFARQLVNERLNEVRSRIPPGIEPSLGPVATAFGEVYQYTLDSTTTSAADLKTLHDWDLKPLLRAVPGVAEVNTWGGFTTRYEIVVRPQSLRAYGLTLRDVFLAIQENNENFRAGFVEHASEQYTVRGLGLVGSEQEIASIVVASHLGTPIHVHDIAEVRRGEAPRQGAVTRDGVGERVSGMVIMLKGQNSKSVIERVKAVLSEINLPEGVTLNPFYDQSEVIDATIRTVRNNLLEGGALVAFVLLVFLGDLRAAVIVAAVIPLSMLCAFVGMELFGITANLMSLGAIDFGLIVDGAVVMVENGVRRLQALPPESRSFSDRLKEIRAGAHEVGRPVLFGVAIIVAVYVPILALEGLEGRMYRPMAVTVVSALVASLLITLVLVPTGSLLLLSRRAGRDHAEWLMAPLRRVYLWVLAHVLRHRVPVAALGALLVAIALGSLNYIGTEFMPRLDEGSILVQTLKLPSISLTESVDAALEVERVLKEFPEVTGVVTKMGRPDIATEAMGIYEGDVYVSLLPREQWTTANTKEGLIEALEVGLANVPGVIYNFTQPMAMRLDETLSGVRADVAVKIFGEDSAQLEAIAEQVLPIVSRVPGAADAQKEVFTGSAEWLVGVRRSELARYGLNVADVRDAVETAIRGRPVSEFIDQHRRFDIVVSLPADVGASREALGGLLLAAPGGEQVPLERVAAITRADGPEAIRRENSRRRLVVQTNVRGRDLGGFVREARAKVAAGVRLPPGYLITWGGQFENQERAMRRLGLVVPAVVLVIFLLLFTAFGSPSQALLALLIIPFASVGGIAALWARDMNLNVSASIGFIAVFGVAVLDGVMLVSTTNRLIEDGLERGKAVMEAAALRLRPVIMTSMVAAIGFLPMAVATSRGAEIQRPLATVVIGGLVSSTLLTLLLLPALYSWFTPQRQSRQAD